MNLHNLLDVRLSCSTSTSTDWSPSDPAPESEPKPRSTGLPNRENGHCRRCGRTARTWYVFGSPHYGEPQEQLNSMTLYMPVYIQSRVPPRQPGAKYPLDDRHPCPSGVSPFWRVISFPGLEVRFSPGYTPINCSAGIPLSNNQ